ncbi:MULTISPECIES: ABC transporter substrate-binding protein [unclassified Amycolatopsis]|uniref:ABC transporter substrate-binding protein n=1 Tax=unclassified Amycolatopsis TaxID=2618356 RepID=UPI00287679AB|nr:MULTISPECIES: ABC transporter substrate-binding protein [unclassified Amycolatopsis]MDS0132817.1 ABC transporter substrate-binding protein [Amycolatopsis sp. 505]MDS0142358.1 ABC transporter substrate-binding protein [Amycolatopsis sp. CM201R]
MRLKRTIGVLAAVAVAAAGLTACRDSREIALGTTGKPHIKIMVGGLSKVIYLPGQLAQQIGAYQKQGLDVELFDQPSGANAETSLLAGEVQAVVGFYDHTIDLQAKEQCIESVVQFANVPGEAEMVATAKAGEVRSGADFKGRNLGVTSLGSSTDFLTKALALRGGVTSKEYTPVKVGAGQTFISAMNQGSIDAGMTTDPTIAQLTNTGQAKVLYDMRTVEGTKAALGGLYPASSLYMGCEIVKRYPDIVQKLANAYVETLKWISSHTPEQVAAMMPPSFAGGDKALYVKSLRDSLPMFTKDGRMDPAGAQNVLKVLGESSSNVKPKKDKIDLSKTYTTQFVDAAHAQAQQ